ncbi:MAG TPA: SDR family NAD(P)-dependent oxidoreductase [Solirubrobacteraceae bacterium]|nr:SDR family NAD(P)-dependent oxidoreductase [Solirubrobacteraceae bacterium]
MASGQVSEAPAAGDRRAALVTGAAGGIGRAIAARLERDGLGVLSVDLRPDAEGPGVPFEADLTREPDNQAAVAAAIERFGRLDVVVAGAGYQHVAPIAELQVERWRSMIDLMLTSPFLLARAAWPSLRASPAGRFIAIASVHGLVASPFKAPYVSAKHGLIGLVRTLALEGAEDGIAAIAVCPGYVRTPLVQAQIADQARAHGLAEEEVLERVILAPHAIKQLLEPEEVADVVALLAGPAGRAFTGAPVTMDLGWTAR